MRKMILFSIVVALFFMQSLVYAISFKDINSSHWAYKYVIELSANKVINGYTDGTFKPESTITRAEFIKLVVMAALPEWIDATAPFSLIRNIIFIQEEHLTEKDV